MRTNNQHHQSRPQTTATKGYYPTPQTKGIEEALNERRTTAIDKNPATFLKAREMASRVGVSIKTLNRWAKAGLIDRFKPNPRLVLYDPNNVINYLRNANVNPADE